jgi:RHS repeat-associated protein
MTLSGGGTLVSGISYNAAGQMTQLTYEGWTETRQYNVLGQLTRITIPGVFDVEYRFSATQNNGRITSMKDWITGEDVTYQYDSLQRLLSASTTAGSPPWSQSYGYDGFGNLTSKAGSNWTVEVATNRVTGLTYDANGNQIPVPGTTSYDVANRMNVGDGTEHYGYAADNRRVWKWKVGSTEEVTFWGPGGRLANYTVGTVGSTLVFTEVTRNVWFGGKLIRTGLISAQKSVVVDRLGSVRIRKQGSTTERLEYYPYGEEKPSATAQDNEKFATYYRDAAGWDYADQRYYQSTWGRFSTPDPYKASSGPVEPASWNQYSYVESDPINWLDPRGLEKCSHANCVEVTAPFPRVPIEDVKATEQQGAGSRTPGVDERGGGGSGGRPSRSDNTEGKESLKKVRERIREKKDCAKALGAKDATEALKKIDEVTISRRNLGVHRAVPDNSPDGYRIELARVAEAVLHGETITVNGNFWDSPRVAAVYRTDAEGAVLQPRIIATVVNMPLALGVSVGRMFSTEHFQDFVIAHELSHSLGNEHDKIDNKEIARECFGDLPVMD